VHTVAVRERAANLLGAFAVALGGRVERAAEAASGRSGARAAALTTLAQWPGGTIEQLRHALGLSHSATVRVIDGLVADGLAARQPLGGGPAVRPVLTVAGAALARDVLRARRDVTVAALAVLSDDEVAALNRALEVLLDTITVDPCTGDWVCRLCELAACPQERCPVEVKQQRLREDGTCP
jgi:DNA-binding MarR family transcriptional regulator